MCCIGIGDFSDIVNHTTCDLWARELHLSGECRIGENLNLEVGIPICDIGVGLTYG